MMLNKIKNFGDSQLIHGDCLEVLRQLPDNYFDAVITDPPYGITQGKWDFPISFVDMWKELNRVTKPNGAILLFCAEPFTSQLICSNLKAFKYRINWHKNKSTGFLNAKRQPLRNIEDIAVFYRKQCTYNPIKTKGHKPVNKFTKNSDGTLVGKTKKGFTGGGSTERHPTLVINHPVVNNDGYGIDGPKLHPSQKPIGLLEDLIETYTNRGERVLDFTSGSGSLCVAAINTGRIFTAIEKDSVFFNISNCRVEEVFEKSSAKA